MTTIFNSFFNFFSFGVLGLFISFKNYLVSTPDNVGVGAIGFAKLSNLHIININFTIKYIFL